MRYLGFLVAAVLCLTGPLSAQDETENAATDLASMSDDELIAKLRDRSNSWVSNPCTIGVPVHAELYSRHPDRMTIKSGLLYSEALCADEVGNFDLGAAKTAELEALLPDKDFTGLFLYFARRNEAVDAALQRLLVLEMEQVAELHPDSFWELARMINRKGKTDELEDVALSWVKTGKLASISVELESGVAYKALTAAVRNGETELIDSLLALVRRPGTHVGMLADKKFQSIWPQVEKSAGHGLTEITGRYSSWALARLDTNEADRDRFSDAAHSLHFAGRYQEAIDLTQKWRERKSDIANIEEGDGWAMNIQAYAYDALGRFEEADAVFDELATLDPEESPWVVNFVINRASRLVGLGRWEEGLQAAGLARKVAENHGSPYAKMIVAEDHVCALTHLGRNDEVEPELAFLRENWDEGPALAASALMCAGLRDEAAALVRKALADEGQRAIILPDLQARKFELFYSPSILPGIDDLLTDYPDLRADFEQYARVIPDEFTPIAFERRVKR